MSMEAPGPTSMEAARTAIIELISQPVRRQERLDNLISQVFRINTRHELVAEIAAFFKLIGPRINLLSSESIEAIMMLLYYLEVDADPDIREELIETDKKGGDEGLTKADAKKEINDRDEVWNEELARLLIRKLREAYAVLGVDVHQTSPAEAQQQGQAISALATLERVELEKQYLSSSKSSELKNRLLEDA